MEIKEFIKNNLLQGLENYTNSLKLVLENRRDKKDIQLNQLVFLYANIEVLISKGKDANLWNEIVYPTQHIQSQLMLVIRQIFDK